MANDSTALNLAMPVGLPAVGEDAATYFAELATRIDVSSTPDNVLSVWTDPDDRFSGVYSMIRAAIWFVPFGSPGLDGITPVSSPTLYYRTWPWEYLTLRTAAGGNDVAVPAIISCSNLDETVVRTDVASELTNNPTYSKLTDEERASALDSFMAGTSLLLVEVGTRLGRAQVDSAHVSSYRKLVLTLYDADENFLAPPFQFSVFATIGGAWVEGHPLLDLVQGPLTPAIAPIEGGIRIRFKGSGLTDASSITFGGALGMDIRVSSDGLFLYSTVPAGAAGIVDISVDGASYPSAFAYTEDVVATANAALQSLALHISEIVGYAASLSSLGLLDDQVRAALYLELDDAGFTMPDAIDARSSASGAAALDPSATNLIEAAIPDLTAAILTAYSTIG